MSDRDLLRYICNIGRRLMNCLPGMYGVEMYIKTEAIVIREVEINDSDMLLELLSKERGVLTVKAKGVRRSASQLKGGCQLLTLSEFTLFDYRGKLSVQEVQPLEQFRYLRENIELLALGSYFAQAAGTVAQEDAPNPELLSLLCNALYALSALRKPQALVKSAFELRLACLAGFTPDLTVCTVCGSAEPDRFDLSHGSLSCSECREADSGIRMPLTQGMLMAMRYIVWCEAKKLFAFKLTAESLQELSSLTEAYLMTQLEHSFYTLDFYKSLAFYGETL